MVNEFSFTEAPLPDPSPEDKLQAFSYNPLASQLQNIMFPTYSLTVLEIVFFYDNMEKKQVLETLKTILSPI